MLLKTCSLATETLHRISSWSTLLVIYSHPMSGQGKMLLTYRDTRGLQGILKVDTFVIRQPQKEAQPHSPPTAEDNTGHCELIHGYMKG